MFSPLKSIDISLFFYDTIDRADSNTVRAVFLILALITYFGIDNIYILSLVNRCQRAFRLAQSAGGTFERYLHSHFCCPSALSLSTCPLHLKV